MKMRIHLRWASAAAVALAAFACGGEEQPAAPDAAPAAEARAPKPRAGAGERAADAHAAQAPEAASPAAANLAPAPKKRIAMIANYASAFWREAEAGGRAAAEAIGAEFEARYLPSGSADEQRQILETLAAEGWDGIALSPLDPAAIGAAIDAAAAAIVTIGADAPATKRAAHVGTNDYEAGRLAGEEIAKAMHEGGSVMLFAGAPEAGAEAERVRGILDALQGTGIEILETRSDQGSAAQAEAGAKDALASNASLSCLVGVGAYHGPALAAAARAAARAGRTQIVCFDAEPATLDAIREGTIRAAITEKPFELGNQTVRLLAELARGDRSGVPEGGLIHGGANAINGDNIEAFRTRGGKETP